MFRWIGPFGAARVLPFVRGLLAALALLVAPGARACPVCHSPLGAEVRAGLFGGDLLPNLAAVLLPVPILAALVLAVRRFGLPGIPAEHQVEKDAEKEDGA